MVALSFSSQADTLEKKAIVIKAHEEGNKDRSFGHALVAGIERNGRKVTKRMSQKKYNKRTGIKPFVKFVNLSHVMPTRYQVANELELKEIVKEDKMLKDKRNEMKKVLAKTLTEKYRKMPQTKAADSKASHLMFFFKKLRF